MFRKINYGLRAFALISFFLFVNISLWAQYTSSNDIFDKHLKVEHVSNNVIIVGSGSYYYTAVIGIKTEKGIVAIDAGISPIMTARYRDIIKKEFNREDFIYLINTHGHYDHTSGNQAFKDVPIIAHENCSTEVNEFWNDTARVNRSVYNAEERLKNNQAANEKDSDMWKFYESLIMQISTLNKTLENNFIIISPNITFDDRLNLDLGDVNLQLVFFGEAHTTSDILIHIPEEKTLCIGDLFDKGGKPDFDADNKNLRRLEVMDWVMTQEIEKVIYGHGLVLTKEDLVSFNNNIRR